MCRQSKCRIGYGRNTVVCCMLTLGSWWLHGDLSYRWVPPKPASLTTGVMLGVAQSALHIPVQLAFLILTTIGVIFAIMYNSATPDFYENNAHHKIGWVIVWVLVAQAASGMIHGVSRYVSGDLRSRDIAEDAEEMFMLGNDDDD